MAKFKFNESSVPSTLEEGAIVIVDGVTYVGNSSDEPVEYSNNDTSDISVASWVLDEDDFASDSSTKVPTQQSVKIYVDDKASLLQSNIDSGDTELRTQIDAFSGGEGKTFESLVDAMAVDPLPADNTPFRIDADADDDGNYIYDSSQLDGYLFLSALIKKASGGLDPDDDVAVVSGKDSDGFVKEEVSKSFNRFSSGDIYTNAPVGANPQDRVIDLISAVKSVKLIGFDTSKTYKLSRIARDHSTEGYRFQIFSQNNDGTWTNTIDPFNGFSVTENANGITHVVYADDDGRSVELDVDYRKLTDGSSNQFETDTTNDDPLFILNPIFEERTIEFNPFVRYQEGYPSDSAELAVCSIFEEMRLEGSKPNLPHKVWYVKRNDGGEWRIIINRYEDSSWTRVYDVTASSFVDNWNKEDETYGTRLTATIVWSRIEEEIYNLGETNEPYFVLKQNSFSELPTQSFINASTVFDREVQSAFENFEIFGADPDLDYALHWFSHNYDPHPTRLRIATSSDGGSTWTDAVMDVKTDDYNTWYASVTGDNEVYPSRSEKSGEKVSANIVGKLIIRFTFDGNKLSKELYNDISYLKVNPNNVHAFSPETDFGAWSNVFPNALDNLSAIKSKLLTRDDDIYISLLGDSLTAQHNKTPLSNPETRQPQVINKNWMFFFNKNLSDIKVIADRYDSSVNSFTETGTGWANDDAFFDGLGAFEYNQRQDGGGALTRYTDDDNASVAFDLNLDTYEKFHFVYRRDYRAVSAATISITEGNGKLEVHNGASWVEANGYVIDMRLSDTFGEGRTLGNWRLRMRKASGATGSITVTVSKGVNTDYLMYWGVERWNGNGIFTTNIARGGFNTEQLDANIQGESERPTDFIIFQIPLINEYSDYNDQTQTIIDNVQDFIYGDRSGNLNARSLKNLSNDFADFEVLAVIPHWRSEYLDGDNFIFDYDVATDAPANYVWNRVKNLVQTKGEVGVIDLGAQWRSEAQKRGWNLEESHKGYNSLEKYTFTQDTVHQNDLGSKLWARYIAPIFK